MKGSNVYRVLSPVTQKLPAVAGLGVGEGRLSLCFQDFSAPDRRCESESDITPFATGASSFLISFPKTLQVPTGPSDVPDSGYIFVQKV